MPAFVQSAFKAAGSVTSSTLAFPSNVSAQSLKVAHVISNNTTGTVGASDNVDGTYNVDVNLTNVTSGPVDAITTKPNATAGATTVTFTVSVAAQLRTLIEEFSGVATVSPLDSNGVGSTSSGGSQNTSPDSGASVGSTTQAVELVLGNCGLAASQTISAGSGFTLDAPSGTTRIGAEYLVTSSAGVQDAKFTLGTATQWVALVASYLAAVTATTEGQGPCMSPSISSPC